VRIISGKYKGKILHPDKNFNARPTTDFAKESLFDILANQFDFEDIEVLDLFSGTGSISFEFASRGSKHIEAVDINYKYVSYISKIGRELKFNQLKVHRINAFQFIKICRKEFDIIFADPPYDMEGVDTLPEIVLNKKILKPGGVFVLEHSKNLLFAGNAHLIDHRNYGSVNFSFFK